MNPFFLLTLAAALAFVGCGKDKEDNLPPPAQNLTVEQTDCTLGAFEQRTATAVFTATADWTLAVVYDDADAETDANTDWLSVSSENGPAGEQTIQLIARMNFGNTDRTARVEITCGEQTAQVTVTQSNSDETDFTALFDTGFADVLYKQRYISDAGNITLDDMKKIAAVTELSIGNTSLTSLQGIEYFESLTTLECAYSELESLDLSQNTALTYLDCNSNLLESLDLSQNTALTTLWCQVNLLKSLDLSRNTALTYLNCVVNPGDGSIFPMTVWDDFDPDNIPSGFTKTDWEYGDKTITPVYKKAE